MAPGKEVLDFLLRLVIGISWLQVLVVIVYDMPLFLATRNPDLISGTFGGNPYQMTFYLLAWNVLVIDTFARSKLSLYDLIKLVSIQSIILVIFLLAQFRSFEVVKAFLTTKWTKLRWNSPF